MIGAVHPGSAQLWRGQIPDDSSSKLFSRISLFGYLAPRQSLWKDFPQWGTAHLIKLLTDEEEDCFSTTPSQMWHERSRCMHRPQAHLEKVELSGSADNPMQSI